MANIFSKIINFIFGRTKVKHVQLDEESVKKHNMIRALANENAELKGMLGKIKVEEGRKREGEDDKKEEEEVRWELNTQKKELQKKKYPKYFSLKTFFRKVHTDKKFRTKLGFYSFDRQNLLGKFGDIGFCSDGSILLLDDKNQVLVKNYEIQKIFQSVGGLDVDVKNGLIPINFDGEGSYVPNMVIDDSYSVTPDFNGRLVYTKVSKQPFYKLLEDYRNDIAEKEDRIEELELLNNELNKQINGTKISLRVSEDAVQTTRADLSDTEKEVSAMGKVFRSVLSDLDKTRNANTIMDDNINKLENQVEMLRDEAERQGVKLSFDDALEKIDLIKGVLKQKTIIQPTLQEIQTTTTSPHPTKPAELN